jgi:hypothetical protein
VDGVLGDAATAIAQYAARPIYCRSDDELCTALIDLQALSCRITATMAAAVHEATGRDLPRRLDATSTVGWLRDLLRISPHDARQLTTLGGVLDTRPVLADAVAAGAVNPAQALAIGRILDDVPPPDYPDAGGDPSTTPGGPATTPGGAGGAGEAAADAATSAPDDPSTTPGGAGAAGADAPSDAAATPDPDVTASLLDKVESTLLGYAARFEPAILHQLGQRVLAHLDPDLHDRRLHERLDREQRRARHRRGLTLSSDGLGGIRITGSLDVEGGAVVAAALQPLATPQRGADGPDLRSAAARRADALIDVCRIALAAGGLPDTGGTPPQLTITIDWDALRRDLAVGQLDTGALLSPETTRRLACTAGLLPAVLDGQSVPIDVGRGRRLLTGATRQAVLLRDRGCAFPGCDRPPRWTDIHHITPWQHGGPTDRDNGVALCGHHHRVIHHPDGWTVQLGADRRPEFLPPPHLDPHRTPQRNPYHPRR